MYVKTVAGLVFEPGVLRILEGRKYARYCVQVSAMIAGWALG